MADPGAVREVRWTPLAAGIAAVLMALDPACSLAVRCEDVLDCMSEDFRRERRVGTTYNGLVKALERQAPAMLPLIRRDLRGRALGALATIPPTGGWTLLAVDGSKEELPRTADHEREFGIGDNGIFPQARVTAIVEVHTGLAWDWRIGGSGACEKGHLMEMAADLPEDALLLADGNFVGHPVWSALHECGRQFLIRVGGNVGLLTGLWPKTRIERHGDIVYTWPSARRQTSAPLRLRLIRVEDAASPVFLLTNVLDHRRLSGRAAGAIYRARWGVELFYRMFKRTMGHAKLLSRSGRRARIELEWGLIAATIVTLLGIAALRGRRRDPRRLSPAALFRVLRASLLRGGGHRAGGRLESLGRTLSCAVRDRYVRQSAKRSRRRPITRNTPKQHTLKPPRIREATPEERLLARTLLNANSA